MVRPRKIIQAVRRNGRFINLADLTIIPQALNFEANIDKLREACIQNGVTSDDGDYILLAQGIDGEIATRVIDEFVKTAWLVKIASSIDCREVSMAKLQRKLSTITLC